MKIYLSAKFRDRSHLRTVRDRIWALGHEVISTWLDETVPPNGMDYKLFLRKVGEKDRAEVIAADCIIVDTLEGLAENAGGGRETELGIALGQFQKKLVWIVGPTRGPFQLMADRIFENWEEAIEELRKMGAHEMYVKELGEAFIKGQREHK